MITDSTQTGRTGGCFSSNSTVETPTGTRRISEIQPGDKVLSVDSNGQQVYSDVLLFLDKNRTESREFYQLHTASGTSITLTPSHLIYTVQPESLTPQDEFLFRPNSYILPSETGQLFLDKAVISFAKNVQIGDWVLVTSSNKSSGHFNIEKVVDMSLRVEMGVYAPLTAEGNLVVDGVLSSCYAVINDQNLDHWAFLPIRLTHNLMKGLAYLWTNVSRFLTFRHHVNSIHPDHLRGENNARLSSFDNMKVQERDQGIHWYAQTLYTLSKFLLPSHLYYGV
jgi:hedgehog protein